MFSVLNRRLSHLHNVKQPLFATGFSEILRKTSFWVSVVFFTPHPKTLMILFGKKVKAYFCLGSKQRYEQSAKQVKREGPVNVFALGNAESYSLIAVIFSNIFAQRNKSVTLVQTGEAGEFVM